MEVFKYIYEKFFMRDLLSFVTPGAVVLMAFVYIFGYDAEYVLAKALKSGEASFWVFVPFLGILYVVGFAVQCFGTEIFPLLRLHTRTCNGHTGVPVWRLFFKRACPLCYEAHYKRYRLILRLSDTERDIKSQHERYVVLKQMCGNNMLALSIGLILVVIKDFQSGIVNSPNFFLMVSMLFLIVSLSFGHRTHLMRQALLEDSEVYVRE